MISARNKIDVSTLTAIPPATAQFQNACASGNSPFHRRRTAFMWTNRGMGWRCLETENGMTVIGPRE
jgi:hypothetical protein